MRKIYLIILGAGIIGCSTEPLTNSPDNITSYDAKVNAQNGNEYFDAPSITCGDNTTDTSLELVVTAASTGAMGGFDLHWMTQENYDIYGWNDDYACGKGLPSNNNNNYDLAAGEEVSLYLEDLLDATSDMDCNMPLECGKAYVFQIRAKGEGGQGGLKMSDWSQSFFCSTAACEEMCIYGFGYWKTHGPGDTPPGNQENMWPVESLTLGGTEYNYQELIDIMNMPVNGDEIISLEHHLIAAKLNVANGAGNEEIEAVIETADMILTGELTYTKDQINAVKDQLEAYNESGNCDEED